MQAVGWPKISLPLQNLNCTSVSYTTSSTQSYLACTHSTLIFNGGWWRDHATVVWGRCIISNTGSQFMALDRTGSPLVPDWDKVGFRPCCCVLAPQLAVQVGLICFVPCLHLRRAWFLAGRRLGSTFPWVDTGKGKFHCDGSCPTLFIWGGWVGSGILRCLLGSPAGAKVDP